MPTEKSYLTSILNVKAFDDETREFSGIATTPNPDRAGDVVEPLGAQFKNPIPLLAGHDHGRPIGSVTLNKPTKDGITFTARVAKTADAGSLRDRLDTAWGEIKAGLVRAVSIGFVAKEDGVEPIKGGGRRFTRYELLELSAVTLPMNADALITAVRAFDAAAKAASAESQDQSAETEVAADDTDSTDDTGVNKSAKPRVVRLDDPGRAGPPPFNIRRIVRRTKEPSHEDSG
jgi:HK97 family phage prohead protease